jgi:hypothetical protein
MAKKREARFIISAENKTAATIAKVTGDVSKLGGTFQKLGKLVGPAFAGIATGAAVKGFASMIQRANDLTDALRDSSIRLGIGISDLQAYQLAAGNAGISAEQLTGLIGKLNKAAGEIKLGDGSDKTIAAFEALGISVAEVEKSNPADLFEEVIEGLGGISDPAARAALAMQIFGKSGQAALTLVADGADSLRESRRLLDDLGLSLNEIDGSKVDAANDAIGTLSVVADAAKQKFAAELSPAIAEAANLLLQAGENGETMGARITGAAQVTVQVVDRLLSAASLLGNAFAAGFNVIQGIAAKIGEVVTGSIAVLIDAVGTKTPEAFNFLLAAGETALTYLKQGFADLATTIANAFVAAINSAIGAVETLVNTAANGINGVITAANAIGGTSFGLIPTASFGRASSFDRFPVDRVNLGRVDTFGQGARDNMNGLSAEYGSYAGQQFGDAGTDIRDAYNAGSDLFSLDGGQLNQSLQEARDYANQLTGAIDPAAAPGGTSGGGSGGKGGKGGAVGAMKNLDDAAKKTGSGIKETFNILEEYGKSVTSNIEQAIDSFVRNGELSMKEFARSILADLAAITLKAVILGDILGNQQYGGNGSGLVGSLVSGIFSGGTASFAGGGFTGYGARSGGIDGKGGFPAILHPNETVVDHTRGDMAGGNVTVQQTVIVRETLPSGIASRIVSESTKAAKAAMKDISDRGGMRRKAYRFA